MHASQGYQRPEVARPHPRDPPLPRSRPSAMLPNALVIAFDERVRFEPATRADEPSTRHGSGHSDRSRSTTSLADDQKPGWIVDGQQRSAAIRDADIDTVSRLRHRVHHRQVAEQRSQFILVNSTKPLPKGLIHELLPATQERCLPAKGRHFPPPARATELRRGLAARRRIRTPTNPRASSRTTRS